MSARSIVAGGALSLATGVAGAFVFLAVTPATGDPATSDPTVTVSDTRPSPRTSLPEGGDACYSVVVVNPDGTLTYPDCTDGPLVVTTPTGSLSVAPEPVVSTTPDGPGAEPTNDRDCH